MCVCVGGGGGGNHDKNCTVHFLHIRIENSIMDFGKKQQLLCTLLLCKIIA